MYAPRPEIAHRHERLRTKLMLNIERPTLHVWSLEVRVDASDARNTKTDAGITGERIVECNRIEDYLLLKRGIRRDQAGLVEAE